MDTSPSRTRSGERAFTLIEMMVVVVIIAILSLLAMVGYRRVVLASHVSEATGMVQAVRTAQESYGAETLAYANISASDTSFYPSATPTGTFVTAWGAPCGSACTSGMDWSMLAVHVDGPVTFGYATVAGGPGQAPPTNLTVDGSPLVFPASPVTSWYVVSANCDLDGYGGGGTPGPQTTNVYTSSWSNQVWIDNEGQ